MTTLEFAPFDKEDNVVTLTEEESIDPRSSFEVSSKSISDVMVTFTCPETVEEVWNEIDNLDFISDEKFASISKHALRYLVPVTYDSILHLSSRPYDKTATYGDFILGVKCKAEGPIDVYVGGIKKFTKQCNVGINMLTKKEVVPLIALCFHEVRIEGHAISNIIYGGILSKTVVSQLIEFYERSDNGTLYHVGGGLDITALASRQAKMNAAGITFELP